MSARCPDCHRWFLLLDEGFRCLACEGRWIAREQRRINKPARKQAKKDHIAWHRAHPYLDCRRHPAVALATLPDAEAHARDCWEYWSSLWPLLGPTGHYKKCPDMEWARQLSGDRRLQRMYDRKEWEGRDMLDRAYQGGAPGLGKRA